MIGSTDKEPQMGKKDKSSTDDEPTEKIDNTSLDIQNNTTEPLNDMQVSTEELHSSTDVSDDAVTDCSDVLNNESTTLEQATTESKNADESLSDSIQVENDSPINNDILSENEVFGTTDADGVGAAGCSQADEKIEQLPLQNLSASDMSNSERPNGSIKQPNEHRNNDEQVVVESNNNTSSEAEIDNNNCNEIDEDDFVAIELVSPKKIDGDKQLTSELAVEHPPNSITETNPDNAQEGSVSAAETEPSNNNNITNAATTTIPPPRRKILRHPILTPLTKLPWDRIISGVGSCDMLFNCKYSARQVEDEVREEHTRTIGGHYLENGHQEDLVGREDGYVNLSLGNEYYGEEEADDCNADEIAQQLGLGCCSMLDSETDEEVEVVASEELMNQMNQREADGELLKQQQPMSKDGEEENNLEQVIIKPEQVDENDQQEINEASRLTAPTSDILSNDQKANASWKNSNPSLDMMLYRTMIHE